MDVGMISDNQAEATLIATLVYHPDFILHSDYLKAGYFYNVENGCIYWAIQELYKSGINTIDALNITNMLNSNASVKKQIEAHNLTDIQKFIDMCQYAARHSLEEYKMVANTVIAMSFKRDLVKVSDEIRANCFKSDVELGKLNELVGTKISDLTEQYMTSQEVMLLGEQIDDIWAEIENTDITTRLPSKFPSFNEYFYYEPGELVLLSARMKAGKSAFLTNECVHKIESGVPTLYIDTELSTTTFVKRLICCKTGVKYSNIQNKTYSKEDEKKIQDCIAWIKKQPLVHIYMPAPNMDEIYSICKILKYKMDLKFFVYDYIKSYNADAYANSALLGQMADFLKNKIAGELELAVLSAAQLGRNNMISNSDNIAKAISTGIYWRFKTSEELARDGLDGGNILAYVNINRNGAQTEEEDAIFFNFDGSRLRIEEAKIQKPQTPDPFEEGE